MSLKAQKGYLFYPSKFKKTLADWQMSTLWHQETLWLFDTAPRHFSITNVAAYLEGNAGLIERLIKDNKTYKEISDLLRQNFPEEEGFQKET